MNKKNIKSFPLNLIFILVLTTTLFAVAFLITELRVEADVVNNVTGWAWSENIGWISFNCTNDNSCGTHNYGVNIDTNGNLSGHAWSEHIGWINFNPAEPPGGPSNSARVNIDSGEVSGWVRALAGGADGWDGWIKLRCEGAECNPPLGYGVSINRDTGVFQNWAWGGDVVGWISFNCANDDSCLQASDYRVRTSFS
ncbi:MAG: hypothetical protein KY054_01385, partial [Candidatus Nealsonbacteria bacterium]|nr:hypothetical protein [Candidatus Nealsonbacteria bacterium]